MTANKYRDSKYVVLVCIMGMLLVLGSTIVKMNYLDFGYFIFLIISMMRYWWICHNE